jgi:glycerol-1-phosphatase
VTGADGIAARGAGSDRGWLLGTAEPLVTSCDVFLFDLDGTVYRGPDPIDEVPRTIAAVRSAGARPVFVTNNASRPPEAIARQLVELGIGTMPSEVVTAAQAGAGLLHERLGVGRNVLVVGGEGIRAALTEAGLVAVDRADAGPDAILQGWTPELNWSMLAEGAYALAAGLPWVVTNIDATLPTARGIGPGNGQFVDVLARTAKRDPDEVAGKPGPALLRLAMTRVRGNRPLVVGDRLDTDIAAAVAGGLPSMLVLSGVTTPADLLSAGRDIRPTFVAADLSGILERQPQPVPTGRGWACGRWVSEVDVERGELWAGARTERAAPRDVADGLDLLRAACAAGWSAADAGQRVRPDAELVRSLSALGRQGLRPVSESAEHRP